MDDNIFTKYESDVRSYCRKWPVIFDKAKGSILETVDGKKYIDFFDGAGALNYGHNNDFVKEKVIDYLKNDEIVHSLDMYTKAKLEFIDSFENKILKPRGLDYKIQFPGPTGTNANEAAFKLARKYKGRSNIFALMGCFHGMTIGSLALTTDKSGRGGAGVPLVGVTHIPAPYMFDTIKYIRTILEDDHSGIEKPAAIALETVQAEGGIYVFSEEFLKEIRKICDEYDILLIVDDIQVGCSRTGTFFSFERAGIVPDIVTMSKSIGAYGLPFAITLFKPELDCWTPGEHNGTFRGNNLAFVAAKAGIEITLNEHVEDEVKRKEKIIKEYLESEIKPLLDDIEIRGIGMIWGIDVKTGKKAKAIVDTCFEKGLIIERAGRDDSVVKIMPQLLIDDETLLKGLTIIKDAIKENI